MSNVKRILVEVVDCYGDSYLLPCSTGELRTILDGPKDMERITTDEGSG